MDSGYSNYEDTTALPRHRWYYYKEGFSPNLVTEAIQKTEITKEDLIIDPFNGSGTTTLTASTLGYKSVGIEVNPFTSFLSKTKSKDVNLNLLNTAENLLLKGCEKGMPSPLSGYSTFSKTGDLNKWLFNDEVLTSFEGGWLKTNEIASYDIRKILRLSLISAAMQNCNARRDGKCLRYKPSWDQKNFDRASFMASFDANLTIIKEDIENHPVTKNATIINEDARRFLSTNNLSKKFKLCITSPPYLNTFDYTDIYRPELFLGKFVQSSEQLYNLRLQTVRSHVQAKWDLPCLDDFGFLYSQAISHVNANTEHLMHKNIPLMIQAYFEDMYNILKLLRGKADNNAQLWFVVSNSAYANMEIPVDLIIAEIGSKAGWALKDIGVLRNIKRRKTKHSPDITHLRESVIIFNATKSHPKKNSD